MNRQNKNNNKKSNNTHSHKILSTDTPSIIHTAPTALQRQTKQKKNRIEPLDITTVQISVHSTQSMAKAREKKESKRYTLCVCVHSNLKMKTNT